MKWTVEVTHAATGEELVVVIDAGTRAQAAARAADSGLIVRDCYHEGRGLCKVARVVAWVWFGVFALPAVLSVFCGLGGWFATPGDAGIGASLGFAAFCAVLASLGYLAALATTDALRREPRADPRHGFDVVQPPPPAPPH
jgi:hypothetical protein